MISLVIIRRMVGRFSYSPQARQLWSLFGAWWGDSFTRPRLDISGCRPAHGREILLLAPGWTSLVVVRCMMEEILLLARGWTSLVIGWHMVGRFSYSPQAGHLWSLFGAWWGGSLTHPRLDILHHRLVHGGEILLLASAGLLWSSFSAWWGDSLTCCRLYRDRYLKDISEDRRGDRERRTYIGTSQKREMGREEKSKSKYLSKQVSRDGPGDKEWKTYIGITGY